MSEGRASAPDVAGEFLLHDGAVFAPFTEQKFGPVGSGGDGFSFGGTEAESEGELTFAEAGVFFEGPAFLEFDLGLWGAVKVGDLDRSFVEPGEGGGEEFVEPFDLAFF